MIVFFYFPGISKASAPSSAASSSNQSEKATGRRYNSDLLEILSGNLLWGHFYLKYCYITVILLEMPPALV